jgi:hypothetical protein
MRRILLLVAVAAACSYASTARADGDPASDYLLGQQVFLPFDAKIPQARQRSFIEFVKSVNSSGYKIRVAIIWSTYDLGAITALWKKPQTYAHFLSAELQFIYKHRLLIAMPNGFGFYWPHHPVAAERAVLTKIPIGTGPVALVDAAQTAVQKLAAASGVRVTAKPVKESGGHSHGRAIIILAVVACVAISVLLRVTLRRQRP